MAFEIWDTDSGNLVGAFASEDAALAIVRTTVRELGESAVESWALADMDEQPEDAPTIEGATLVRHALSRAATR